MSKAGFPTSDPASMVIPLDHGLEAPCHEARNLARSFSIISDWLIEFLIAAGGSPETSARGY
ncbi:MAG TPA: hypothetical protein VIM11_02840, partial [Tepidisphaeraceae bacterium]